MPSTLLRSIQALKKHLLEYEDRHDNPVWHIFISAHASQRGVHTPLGQAWDHVPLNLAHCQVHGQ